MGGGGIVVVVCGKYEVKFVVEKICGPPKVLVTKFHQLLPMHH